MPPSNPVLVRLTRGDRIESEHRGAVVVCDAQGAIRLAHGDIDRPVFPRSAIKAIQALALVESGAADAYEFGDRELALACASHSGETEHVNVVTSMLARAGFNESALECGGHWSSHQPVLIEQARKLSKKPGALYNNCSGKHAGFVCTARHNGVSPADYIDRDHPVQRDVRAVIEQVTGQIIDEDVCGIDGCSIPTYAIVLKRLAQGFARLITGQGLTPGRARAARRLTVACMNEPFYVAGTNRFCTRIMQCAEGRIFVKTGAEGVFCGAIPELALGIAIKCDDGATRAAEAIMAATLARLFSDGDRLQPLLAGFRDQALTNWNGIQVGQMRAGLPD